MAGQQQHNQIQQNQNGQIPPKSFKNRQNSIEGRLLHTITWVSTFFVLFCLTWFGLVCLLIGLVTYYFALLFYYDFMLRFAFWLFWALFSLCFFIKVSHPVNLFPWFLLWKVGLVWDPEKNGVPGSLSKSRLQKTRSLIYRKRRGSLVSSLFE